MECVFTFFAFLTPCPFSIFYLFNFSLQTKKWCSHAEASVMLVQVKVRGEKGKLAEDES